jgi:hypothetical protein
MRQQRLTNALVHSFSKEQQRFRVELSDFPRLRPQKGLQDNRHRGGTVVNVGRSGS